MAGVMLAVIYLFIIFSFCIFTHSAQCAILSHFFFCITDDVTLFNLRKKDFVNVVFFLFFFFFDNKMTC